MSLYDILKEFSLKLFNLFLSNYFSWNSLSSTNIKREKFYRFLQKVAMALHSASSVSTRILHAQVLGYAILLACEDKFSLTIFLRKFLSVKNWGRLPVALSEKFIVADFHIKSVLKKIASKDL